MTTRKGQRVSVPPDASSLGRLGHWSYRHRRRVVLCWVLLLVTLVAAGRIVGSHFEDNFNSGTTQSGQAAALLRTHFPNQAGDSAQVVFHTAGPITSAQNQARIAGTVDDLAHSPDVVVVRSPFGPGGTTQISRSGHVAYATVQFDQPTATLPTHSVQTVVNRARAAAVPGFAVQLGGAPIEKTQKVSFGVSEALGILAAIVILLLAFGSIIAMILPIVTAIVGVVSTFGALDLLGHGLTVPTFTPDVAALVGLGVGIDYSLFVVTRYRGAFHDGAPPARAVEIAMATSGRSVLFAGSTVVVSLLGLFLLGLPFIYGVALGAVIAVFFVVLAAMTLLPAALGFCGEAIDRLRVGGTVSRSRSGADPSVGRGVWWRWSRQVQRKPVLAGSAALLALVILAIPFLSMRLAFTDAGNDPTAFTTRQAYDLIAAGFGPGANGPLVVAVNAPAATRSGTSPSTTSGSTALHTVAVHLADRLRTVPDVVVASPPHFNEAGNVAVITVVPATSPQEARTSDLVHQLRDHVVPPITTGTGTTVLIGGATAASIDAAQVISSRLALVITVVALLSLLLLMAAFRSVVIPITSAIMTLLSTGAAYGMIVAIFQWGWLGTGIDNGRTAPIDPWIPLFLFALLFGLSMDYQVFLLSRVREEWRRHGDNGIAVADGLASTGRVITSAAAIMFCVFGAFVFGDFRALRVFGLGMAIAVLLDATVVRMVLVPSIMELLGRANWWMPHWLDRLVPTLSVEVDVERGDGGAAQPRRERLGVH